MKKHNGWSYAPYKPPFIEVGDIYICRVVPTVDSVRIEWLEEVGECSAFIRKRGEGEFALAGVSTDRSFTFCGLETETDYEFYVACGDKKSRTRLAKTGKSVGTTVNYLHAEDDAYSFSGRYLCSPSIVRHPEGYLLASMDVFEGGAPQNLTLIFRSDDDGDTWHYVSELFPCFWGKMFIYNGELYMLSVSTEYGDLLIGKSSDGGKNFTEPVVLLRGANGKKGSAGVHKNPEPMVEYGGRLWGTLEWGAWASGYHAPMVMSAPIGSDLLDPDNWSYSDPIKYDPNWKGVPKGESNGNIEGSLVEIEGKLYNIMRYSMDKLERKYGLVIAYKVNTEEPERSLEYDHCIEFPGNNSKFMIKRDSVSGTYYSLVTRIYDGEKIWARNLLSLMRSVDCEKWELVRDEIDMRETDSKMIGFQYVDFEIEGDDIIYLCRTAINGAHNFHDANYSTFHRIKNFREL